MGKKDDDNLNKTAIPFRLPTSVIPTHYSLQVIHILTNFTQDSSNSSVHGLFSSPGKVEIDVNVIEPVDNITLHAEDMKIQAVKV